MGSQVVMEFDDALFLRERLVIGSVLKSSPFYLGLTTLPIRGIVKIDKVKGQPTQQTQGSKSKGPQGNRV